MINTRRLEDFGSSVANEKIFGKNILQIKKGSTIVGDMWVHFSDRTVDLDKVVQEFLKSRLNFFRKTNDIKYVLLVFSKEGILKLVPSIGEEINEDAEIRVFENLSEVVPLVLIKLTQDGSSNLSSIKSITNSDLDIYTGYGNFTTKGEYGSLGNPGPTGAPGITGPIGPQGEQGSIGLRGPTGNMGLRGIDILGVTGVRGAPGSC